MSVMALTPEQKAAWEEEKASRARQRQKELEQAELKRAEDEKKINQAVLEADRNEKRAQLLYYAGVIVLSICVGLLVYWIQS